MSPEHHWHAPRFASTSTSTGTTCPMPRCSRNVLNVRMAVGEALGYGVQAGRPSAEGLSERYSHTACAHGFCCYYRARTCHCHVGTRGWLCWFRYRIVGHGIGHHLGTCHTVPISRALEVSRRGKRFHHKAEMGRQILFLVCVKTKISFEGNLWAWGSTGVSTDNSGIEFTAVSLLPGLRTVVVWFKPLRIESVT